MTNLAGAWTALITPFKKDESIDWEAFEALVKEQIKAGVAGILLNGTTGESPTLTDSEFVELIKKGKELTQNKILLMAGVGANCTKKSVEKAKLAERLGVDIMMAVNPYYNKPTQEGLYLHFKKIAEAAPLPLVLYNIKPRAAVNLETDTLLRLIEDCENIVCVKEASGDLAQIKEVCERSPDDFTVLSGDDNLTFQIMRDYGADGVISVISNLVPAKAVEMVNLALEKKFEQAKAIDDYLQPLIKGAFLESNPIPIKAALAMQGKIEEVYRLPICEMSQGKRDEWEEILRKGGLV